MNKADQKAASDRIMAKEPLTAGERQTFNLLAKKPGEYDCPGDKRVCGVCGAEFRDRVDGKGVVVKSALEKFSDHQAEHNPSPGQWAEAHRLIQLGKESEKRSAS
jgi:hypothetical protein